MNSEVQITRLLAGIKTGDVECQSAFVNAVYGELKRIAAQQVRGEPAGNSMQASALVNEAYLKMLGGKQGNWENRAHFFAAACSTMRHILIDRARARRARKRDGGLKRVDLEDMPNLAMAESDLGAERLLALDAALEELAQLDARQARVVELRFFTGLTFEEAAHVLGVSSRTAKRDWDHARAWLHNKTAGTGPK
ncbi:MAG: sigma-70 family RNA polymerase sigma factor [Bryobacterales bacterium]|nr:sigma-70 family RNA polymerase sigma factor [Bryobacterales bacterium]